MNLAWLAGGWATLHPALEVDSGACVDPQSDADVEAGRPTVLHYCEPYEYAPGHMWDKRAVGLALKMANASSMLACDTPLFKPLAQAPPPRQRSG